MLFCFYFFSFPPVARVSNGARTSPREKPFAKMFATFCIDSLTLYLSPFFHSFFPFSLRRFTALWSLHSPSNFASQTSQFFSFSLFPLFFFLLLFNFSFSFISLSHLSRSAVLLVKHGQLSDIPGGSRAGLKTSRRRRNITRKPL